MPYNDTLKWVLHNMSVIFKEHITSKRVLNYGSKCWKDRKKEKKKMIVFLFRYSDHRCFVFHYSNNLQPGRPCIWHNLKINQGRTSAFKTTDLKKNSQAKHKYINEPPPCLQLTL